MRRAQFEVLGLAVIVILVSVIIFFLLAIGLQPSSDPNRQFQEEQFSQNIIDALLKTSLIECRGTVADYIVWRAEDRYPNPVVIGARCAKPEGLEDIAQAVHESITTYSGNQYVFQIRDGPCRVDGSDCIFILNHPPVDDPNRCDLSAQNRFRAGRQLISRYPNPEELEIILFLCQPRR